MPGGLVLASERNQVRQRAYHRWDVRLSHAIDMRRRRLTLYAEVMNVTNHKNTRLDSVEKRLGARTLRLDETELFPVLPAVGLTLDF